MDPVLIAVAFVAGLAIYQFGLPPLIGFLVAGFILNAMGYESTSALQTLGDLGITILLFTIGLKLKLKDLFHKEVWAGASVHMLAIFLVNLLVLYLLVQLGLPLLENAQYQSLMILAFALGFSSTVFAVKILDEKGQMSSFFGRTAIGILIMQDIFAVVFLTASTGKLPSVWALGLFLLPLLRPLLYRVLDRAGHGELLVLYGVFLALSLGAGLFELVQLKPDLGALIVGMLLANHEKAQEMAKSLLNIKELLLVVFFLNIGMSALPNWDSVLFAVLLLILLPIKAILFHLVLTLFNLRARTAMLSSLTLSNFSEFGLIVGAIGVSMGMLSEELLVALALALSLTFVLGAPLLEKAPDIYQKFHDSLVNHERHPLHYEDQEIDPGEAQVIILGMGRVGTGAYDFMATYHQDKKILGVDQDLSVFERHKQTGRNVIEGDATDSDFWEKARLSHQVELVMLAMPMHQGNYFAAERLRAMDYKGKIAAIASYDDHAKELKELGVDVVFDFYSEAGAGFAEHVCEILLEDHFTMEVSDQK